MGIEWGDDTLDDDRPSEKPHLPHMLDQLTAERDRLKVQTEEMAAALKLALEYWAHRQQRYKNRHPVWVQKAHAALGIEKPNVTGY